MPVKHQQRITRARALSLLEDLANFHGFLRFRAEEGPPLQVAQYRARARAIARRFPQVFSELQGVVGDGRKDFLFKTMFGLQEHIRQAWRGPDIGARKWIIDELRRLWQRISRKARQVSSPGDRLNEIALKEIEWTTFWGWYPNPMPALTGFEQVMIHFERALPQARFCANPACNNPYFFSYKRRKSCSAGCANVQKAEYKRQWWAKIGKRRRQVLNRQKSQRRLKP